jgi:hypothetical protein
MSKADDDLRYMNARLADFEQKLARVGDLIAEHGADAVLPKVNAGMKLRRCGSDAKLRELKAQLDVEIDCFEFSLRQSFRNDALRKKIDEENRKGK